MTPDTENFDKLRRLLKVKRYEQPPPGYFNDFSRQVIAQIRAGANQGEGHFWDRMSWEVPWLQSLMESFQAKPALAVGFGAAVCALLVGGVIYSESLDYKPVPMMPSVELLANPQTAASAPALAFGGLGEGTLPAIGTNISVNPILPSGGSLFDEFRIHPQPVGLLPVGGN